MQTRNNPQQQLDQLLGRRVPPNPQPIQTPRTYWKEYLAVAEDFITTRPGLSLIFAAGLGCAMGWWMKRK